MMTRLIHLYPLICMSLNLIFGFVLHWFNTICITNYNSMGFAYPNSTVWALRFPYIYYLLAVIGAGLLCLSLIKKISVNLLFGVTFALMAIDAGLLLISAIGYSMPFLVFPVVIE